MTATKPEKINQNLTLYLDVETAERVANAKLAGTLDAKAVMKAALLTALDGGPAQISQEEFSELLQERGKIVISLDQHTPEEYHREHGARDGKALHEQVEHLLGWFHAMLKSY